MAKPKAPAVALCPNPECQTPILLDHPYTWCFVCGKPLPDDVKDKLLALQKEKAGASDNFTFTSDVKVDPSVYRSRFVKSGQSKVATPAILIGALGIFISSFSASAGRGYGIAGVTIGLANVFCGVWYKAEPSSVPMLAIGVSLVSLVAWIMADLLSVANPGPMAVLGVLAFLLLAIYAFWLAIKLRTKPLS